MGNLVGNRTIEPYGKATIVNLETGEECVIDFKTRGKNNDVSAEIKEASGSILHTMKGDYNSQIKLDNGKVIYESPRTFYPPGSKDIWGMSYFSL